LFKKNKKGEIMKKFFSYIIAELLMLQSFVFANDDPLASTGEQAKSSLRNTIHSYTWVVSILVFAVAIGFMVFTYMKIKKDEKGQDAQILTNTQIAMRLIGAGIGGVLATYIALGIFGVGFLGMSFSDVWQHFVTNPLRDLIGVGKS
jgi:heme/copper-type cytochrome/quinol oxidase subunit 2